MVKKKAVPATTPNPPVRIVIPTQGRIDAIRSLAKAIETLALALQTPTHVSVTNSVFTSSGDAAALSIATGDTETVER